MCGRATRLTPLAIIALASALSLALPSGHAQAAPRSCGASAASSTVNTTQGVSSAARITLSIDHGASGTAISVSGAAWPANAPIIIDFVDTGDQNLGREAIAQAQADPSGAFHSSEFQAPEGWCGRSPGAGTVSLVVAHTSD